MSNRISINEERLDGINKNIHDLEITLNKFKNNIRDIKLLNKYYGSKSWFKDKEDYENGKIPKIKAGVLSEDAVWNMNENISDIINQMKLIVENYNKKD